MVRQDQEPLWTLKDSWAFLNFFVDLVFINSSMSLITHPRFRWSYFLVIPRVLCILSWFSCVLLFVKLLFALFSCVSRPCDCLHLSMICFTCVQLALPTMCLKPLWFPLSVRLLCLVIYPVNVLVPCVMSWSSLSPCVFSLWITPFGFCLFPLSTVNLFWLPIHSNILSVPAYLTDHCVHVPCLLFWPLAVLPHRVPGICRYFTL